MQLNFKSVGACVLPI